MPEQTITYTWEDEDHTILRIDYQRGWTLSDFERVIGDAMTTIQQVSHGVYTLNDFGAELTLPPGFFRVLYRMQKTMPKNLQLAVLVTEDSMREMLLRLVRRIVPIIAENTRLCTTLDEARALIAKHKRDHNAGNGSH